MQQLRCGKRLFRFLSIPLFFFVSEGVTKSVELDQLIESLQRDTSRFEKRAQEQTNAALRLLTELQAALKRGDIAAAEAASRHLVDNESVPSGVKSIAERVNNDLPRLLAERTSSFIKEVDAIVERTRTACLAAQNESDLVPIFKELTSLKERQSGQENAPSLARSFRKLEAAMAATDTWMDYLAFKTLGDTSRAVEVLRNYTRETRSYPILPVSEVAKRMAELGSPDASLLKSNLLAALAKIQTLKDVEVVAPEIDAISTPAGDYEFERVKTFFYNFRAANAAYLAGDSGEAWRRMNENFTHEVGSWLSQTLRLRTMLLSELLPKYMKLPPGDLRRPDETLADHQRRLLGEAAAQGRWEDVQRIATVRLTSPYYFSYNSELSNLSAAVSNFLQARRFEEAGNLPDAIISYQKVLRSTADLAPVRESVERLKELEKTKPEAFAEVHSRQESNRALLMIRQLEETLSEFSTRLAKFEAERAAQRGTGATRTASMPSDANAEVKRLTDRLKAAEEKLQKSADLATRLEKLEVLFGPGAEAALRGIDGSTKFNIWLGADYTVYRSALPPKLEQNLAWVISYNGKRVLSRNAQKEFTYSYHNPQPGNYTVYLTLGSNDSPVSNVLEYSITEEAATKLPHRQDRDLDRDGVPNDVKDH